MTVIKTKHEENIVDLSEQAISKSSLQKSLKNMKLRSVLRKKEGILVTLFITTIKVDVYDIHLNIRDFTGYQYDKDVQLSNVRPFEIFITESNQDRPIDLHVNGAFRNQSWIDVNDACKLHIDGLIEAIIHCKRISDMKSFL